jgi:hypothetical protein
MTQIRLAKSVGGYESRFSEAGEDVYNKFMTTSAINRLGR